MMKIRTITGVALAWLVAAAAPAAAGTGCSAVMDWNQRALGATVTANQGAVPQIRSMAIVHASMRRGSDRGRGLRARPAVPVAGMGRHARRIARSVRADLRGSGSGRRSGHFRTSDETGARMGRQGARFVFNHALND